MRKFLDDSNDTSNYSHHISEDLQNFLNGSGESARFDKRSIEIARTLVADSHVDEDSPLGHITLDDPNEVQDITTEQLSYDIKGPINPDVKIIVEALSNKEEMHRVKHTLSRTEEKRQLDLMFDDLEEQFPPPMVAPVQIHSTNKSALNMARLLFNLKVRRWYLPLLLIDIQLDGIDPHSDNLPDLIKEKISVEIQKNVFYYCREVVRIPAPGYTEGTQMRIHIGAFTSIFLTANDISYYLEQPRQTYKSGTDNALMGWCWNFAARNSKMALFANNNGKAKDNLMNVIDILELLPDYLQFFRYQNKSDKNGVIQITECQDYAKGMEIHHKLLDNRLMAATTGQTKENAMKTGRGKSLVKIGFDEIGFSKYNWFAYGSAQPSHEEAAALADKSGIPHNITMTSTPPDATTKEGEWLHKLLFEDCVKFSLKLFDLNKEEIHEYMRANGKKDIIFCSFAYNELGFTQEWLIDRLRKLDRNMFDVEVMLKWKRVLNRSPFSRRALELIEIYAKNSKSEQITLNNKDVFTVYEDFHKSKMKRIIIAMDIAGGGGNNNDYSTMVGVDPHTTKVLFTFRSNEMDTDIFAKTAIQFYREHTPNAILVVERNGIGQGVVDKLKHCDDIVDNLYYQGNSDKRALYINERDANVTKGQYGLYVDHNVREIMHKEILNQRVNRYKTYFNSPDIVRELMSIAVTASGRYDHLPGYHDDLLMAYLMALYVLYKDMDMDIKFAINVPSILDDEAKAFNKSDVFNKEQFSQVKLTPEQEMMEFIKNNAIRGGEARGFMTLEDDTYRRDVAWGKAVQSINEDITDDIDREVTTEMMRGMGRTREGNSLMPSAARKKLW